MLQKMAASCAPWWRRSPRQEGFVLVDYVLSLAVGAVLAALVCTALARTAVSWQRLVDQLELVQAASYMQGVLERQLGYNASAIRLKSDGNVELDTVEGNKKLLIYYRKGGLYLQTTTGNGSGTNPLFIAEVDVCEWTVTRLTATTMRIDFALQGRQGQRSFTRIVTCYNGEISDEKL